MINDHPCYSKDAHYSYARIHLPVAPACNIQCNYCNRKFDCSNESRPGVTSQKLKPIDALKKVLLVGSEIKNLSVVGIAGPGDALANPQKTFETLALVREHAPDLKLCLSTNGLKLPEFVEQIKEAGVDHITVTINTIDPKVGAQIYPWVYFEGKRYKGEEAAALLLSKQLEGIKKCVEAGILIKANSVLIPGVNEDDLPNVSKKLKELGVFLHNIMPLLSEPEFGTYYGLNGVPSATEEQLAKAQEACGMDMSLMTHCKQCRADAIGILGEDRSAEFTPESFGDKSMEELVALYDIEGRKKEKEKIEGFRLILKEANERAESERKMLSSRGETVMMAVTSSDFESVNEHFGTVKEFLIYEAGDMGFRFLTKRSVGAGYCAGPDSCENPMDDIKAALHDVKLLITAKIGGCPQDTLKEVGVVSIEKYAKAPIAEAVMSAAKEYFGHESEEG
ncbi:MAG TPA: nitrogenase cofactor biosynthesis protein NifB [Campylobacterales bacterium]|nr:nitrogenase cofactor biosynthesis protein NifB [Campylobacterales bacterium]